MAVAAANCINIPIMRQAELMNGIIVTDKDGNNLAKSKVCDLSCLMHNVDGLHFTLFPAGCKNGDFPCIGVQDYSCLSHNE